MNLTITPPSPPSPLLPGSPTLLPQLPAGAKVLVIDDEEVNIALLEDLLGTAAPGLRIRSLSDPRGAVAAFREFGPDLVLLDLNMPHLDGFAVMEALAAVIPADAYVPILVLTADAGQPARRRALGAGATDFLSKPFDQFEVLLRIRNLLTTRTQHLQLMAQNEGLDAAVGERTRELNHALQQLQATQGQVIQHERLSALGTMAAGIAHDFNNTLALILGYGELALYQLHGPDGKQAATGLLTHIIGSAQDAATMFNRLRDFARPAESASLRQTVNLNALVEQAAAVTRPRWHGQALAAGVTVALERELAPGLPSIIGDAAELREMLTNLIFNAVDALPAGGAITLRTRAIDGVVILEVSDDGAGMDEETRRRCLEPFFTTKGDKGTGLGLAMVYGTVTRHGGHIDLASAPGRGTTFTITIPRDFPRFHPPGEDGAQGDDDAAAGVEPLPPPAPVALRILAVDDQPVLCEILAESLSGDGHLVETAEDGREALEKFTSAGASYEVVITDQAMPGMNGDELAAAVKACRPETRVILLTGFGSLDHGAGRRDTALPIGESPIDLILDKPATRTELRRALLQVMRPIPIAVASAAP